MKKRLLMALFFAVLCIRPVLADEGMWLVHLLGEQVYADMTKKGLKLSKEQLFSLNKASIKDAIIIFGGGCTGEIVSAQGLIFTNHHCGYDAIASASTVENNYLRDGFWAKNFAQEIPSAGLSAQFLVRIEDVTAQVEKELGDLNGAARTQKMMATFQEIQKKSVEGTALEARVVPMFRGNQFLMFVYERYRDVRLVGTPPESIGKFGGDTDNWEWPRHTGDFSVFRVYMGKDGKPSAYSAENVPLKAKYHLPISTKGFKDGDFAMIYGYPGGTNRYETSFGVKLKTDIDNPTLVALRDLRLKSMFEEMKKDDAVRLKLASDYAGIANYWKFFDGEAKQLLKFNTFEQKQKEEQAFRDWANGKPQYESIFMPLEAAYQAWRPYAKHRMFINEGLMGSPLIAFSAQMQALERALTKKPVNPEEVAKVAKTMDAARANYMEGANAASDERIVAQVGHKFFTEISAEQFPPGFYDAFSAIYGDPTYPESFQKFAADVFAKTIIRDNVRWGNFIANPDSATLQNDPAYKYAVTFQRNYASRFAKGFADLTNANNDFGRMYLKGIAEMNPKATRYPDANFTMRVSYGQVKSYRPRDAVFYDYVCTLSGVLEKYKPGDYEFDLPPKLRELAAKKDFGPYIDKKANDLVVAFITTNDITGGNSGSPVLNAKGELIGLAFDGNYEALSHKIAFDKDLNRTINVDVRYVLWCIDKLGGASNIISELTLK